MALPQHIRYQVGGMVYIDLDDRPSAATVRILDGDGTVQVSEVAATKSTIATTLNAAVSGGGSEINVTSNTGMAVGGTMWLQDDPEEVLIRQINGATIKLRRPMRYDHVEGAAIEGCRVSYYVNAATQAGANTRWWDGRAEWNIDGTRYYTACECGDYPVQRLASAQDLFDIDPKLYDVLDSETDVERLLDAAHEYVLRELAKAAPDSRARVFTDSMCFRSATALAALYMHHRRRGSVEAQAVADRYRKDLESELAGIVATVPRDADQDGTVEAEEKFGFRSIRLRRA